MSTGAWLLVAALAAVDQPATTAGSASGTLTLFARNTTRLEMWDFFEPPPGGGDPAYAFVANRLHFGVRHATARWDLVGAGQYVQFGNLPSRAFGPGPLGTGGAYYDASGDTTSQQIYLKYLYARVKGLLPGFEVQAGRFGYASGAEASSGVAKIETLKRQRVDSRMIGEFEWSLYQRSFDGVRADWRDSRFHATGAWFRPTQGGFEEEAGAHVGNVDVWSATWTAKPGVWVPHAELQGFLYHYADDRLVTARPDNAGAVAARADVSVTTFGATVVAAIPHGHGELDALAWLAAQTGDWYGTDHGAYSLALEGGYQWATAPWKPWVRGGLNISSGDDSPGHNTHSTFFQMLPTARKYAFSAVYTQMNLRDLFAQVLLRPRAPLAIRLDIHHLGLSSEEDGWYFGSGVTQERGSGFGFGLRPSGDQTDLGTIVEGTVEYFISRWWSVNGYAGWMRAGDVVRRSFRGDALTFAYLENIINF